MTIEEKLKAPFKKIHWRISRKTKDGKKAAVLAYLNARDVRHRLDEVVGMSNWQVRFPRDGYCEIGIRETVLHEICDPEVCDPDYNAYDRWLWKGDGAGVTAVEAEKGQYSDAFKRAAVTWGIGMYLYYLPDIWVPLKNEYGDFDAPQLPAWAQYKED